MLVPELILLDNTGKAVWCCINNRCLFVERPHADVDRVIVIYEDDDRRRIVDDVAFTVFDFTDYRPMTQTEYSRVKRSYRKIYG